MGEGGAGRVERPALPVGGYRYGPARAGELLQRFVLFLRYKPDAGLPPDVCHRRFSLHQPGGIFRSERVWALRYGGEYLGVVLGPVFSDVLFLIAVIGPAWPGVGVVPGGAGGAARGITSRGDAVPRLAAGSIRAIRTSTSGFVLRGLLNRYMYTLFPCTLCPGVWGRSPHALKESRQLEK